VLTKNLRTLQPHQPTCACRCTTISVYIYIFWAQKLNLNARVPALLRRCYSCRSRGDLGTCKDPFTLNLTLAEQERGVEAVPCASGWCGKFLEGGNSFKDDGEIYSEVHIALSADIIQKIATLILVRTNTHVRRKYNNFRLTLVAGRVPLGVYTGSSDSFVALSSTVCYSIWISVISSHLRHFNWILPLRTWGPYKGSFCSSCTSKQIITHQCRVVPLCCPFTLQFIRNKLRTLNTYINMRTEHTYLPLILFTGSKVTVLLVSVSHFCPS
jgi:hypothetical protein